LAARNRQANEPSKARLRAAAEDPAFAAGNPFFDRDDLVQVKLEMLRRVRQEQAPVSRAAAAFGFSRPSFYAGQAVFDRAGLPGLVPKRPGPRRAHKLTEAVVDVLDASTEVVAEFRYPRAGRRGTPWRLLSAFGQQRWRDRAQGRLRIVLGERED